MRSTMLRPMPNVLTGLEQLITAPPRGLKGRRLGLLCNAASVDGHLIHARQRISACFKGQLRALYSPQHGFGTEKQDNMIESGHGRDALLDIPIYSLYSETRIPTKEMLDGIDVLLVDLQDVGTRVYTFVYTVSYCMEAARAHGKKIMILDRPNPVGGELVEGNCLKPAWTSFVGRYPIPMRHGLTIGEWALLVNTEYGIGCDLEVIRLKGWQRRMLFQDTGLPWVAPSPNLPTPTSALVYPGQVIWEGTNISEGRGTTQPFELFGAPFIDPETVFQALGKKHPPGAFLRPVAFEPTSNKWQGEICRGFQLHVTDPDHYRPYATSLALLQAIMKSHPHEFQWKQPPYEYDFERLPIDLILGDQELRIQLSGMTPVDEIGTSWESALSDYRNVRQAYLCYH